MKPPDLVCVDPKRVHEIWPHVEPILRSAYERTGVSSFKDLVDDILYGEALVWLAWGGSVEAAAATILRETDGGLVCVIAACGGSDMHRWLPLLEKIETYAKAEGCKRTRIVGREGWLRVLDGYAKTNVILDKELI